MIDLLDKFDAVAGERQAYLDAGGRDPVGVVMSAVHSPTRAVIAGRETILVGTYNYMGMTFDPDVIAAGEAALRDFGAGTTGSRSLNGTYASHRACEDALRDFYDTKHAMVFSTGYLANLGIVSTLAGRGDYVVLDADSHASIYDGCAMGNADIVRFRHNSVEDLDKRLGRLPVEAGKLVVLEGVYSMLGDVAPLAGMVTVAKRHGAMVLVDEAHAMGFFGAARPRRHGGGRCRGGRRFHHRHLLEVGWHRRRLLRLEPPQVRIAAIGLPPVHLHRLAAAVGRRVFGDVDPQADAQSQQASASMGKHTRDARRLARAGLHARHRNGGKRDHRGDHARPGDDARDVAGAPRARRICQLRAPPGDADWRVPPALLAVR